MFAGASSASHGYHVASNAVERYTRGSDDRLIAESADDYEAAGNRTGVLESGGDRVTWTYDASDQLTREQRSGPSAYDTTYTYDPLGNRLVSECLGWENVTKGVAAYASKHYVCAEYRPGPVCGPPVPPNYRRHTGIDTVLRRPIS